MRVFALLSALVCAGCISPVTATEPDARAGVFTLSSIDDDFLPTRPDYSSGSRWVLSGSLTLQPDGYFVLAERDSVWDGHAFAREDRTEGGLWVSDGSLLTLSDTSAGSSDPYGSEAATYVGGISPDAVLLTMQSGDGIESHIYHYKR